MIKRFYSLYDVTAKHYLNPIVASNDGDAIRLFTTFVNGNKEESNIAKYPHQFILFHMYDLDDANGKLGTLNTTTNELDPLSHPRELMIGTQVQEDQQKTFTVKELITMLKAELNLENVIDISEKSLGDKS